MNKPENKYISETGSENFLKRNFSKIRMLFITIFTGLLLGSQLFSPNKRVIESIAGLVVLFLLWQVSTLAALWFVLLTYPFPFAMSWGNSNFIFMIIISIMLVLRVASGEEKFRFDKTLLLPFALILFSYVLSFKNVPFGTSLLRLGLVNTANFVSAGIFAFLLINCIDNEAKLRKAVQFLLITGGLVIVFNVLELAFPGRVLIPGWLHTSHSLGLLKTGLRAKGPFGDFELNAEFLTLNSFIVLFMIIRTKRLLIRYLLGTMLFMDLLLMFATMTRGAFFSLILGVIYIIIISRKELNIVKTVSILAGFVFLLFMLDFLVSNYTVSGSLFARVINTTFESGVVPDTRTNAWGMAIERGMQNPIFGQGPGWDFATGLSTGVWPHSLYLFYFNSIGLVGLSAFLFLMYRIVKATIPGIKSSFTDSPFSEAFMKILNVIIVLFLFDQIKIEYLRNAIYTFFIWTLFALVIITKNIVDKNRREGKI